MLWSKTVTLAIDLYLQDFMHCTAATLLFIGTDAWVKWLSIYGSYDLPSLRVRLRSLSQCLLADWFLPQQLCFLREMTCVIAFHYIISPRNLSGSVVCWSWTKHNLLCSPVRTSKKTQHETCHDVDLKTSHVKFILQGKSGLSSDVMSDCCILYTQKHRL